MFNRTEKEKVPNKTYIAMIVSLAMLVAMEIVLSRFLAIVKTEQLKISFAFIPLAVASYMYGVKGGVAVGALSDFIGAVAFPIGAYFPGFTLTAAFNGAVFGLFLGKNSSLCKNHDKKHILLMTTLAVLVTQVFGSLLLNTLWISKFFTHSPYMTVLMPRLAQTAVMTALEIVIIPIFNEALGRVKSIRMMRI